MAMVDPPSMARSAKDRTVNEVHWSDDMIAALKELRATGVSYMDCADKIGVCHTTVGRKCRQLNLNQKMNKGPLRGTVIMEAL